MDKITLQRISQNITELRVKKINPITVHNPRNGRSRYYYEVIVPERHFFVETSYPYFMYEVTPSMKEFYEEKLSTITGCSTEGLGCSYEGLTSLSAIMALQRASKSRDNTNSTLKFEIYSNNDTQISGDTKVDPKGDPLCTYNPLTHVAISRETYREYSSIQYKHLFLKERLEETIERLKNGMDKG